MIFHATLGHELVDQKSVVILQAVPDQLHKVRVTQLPKIINLGLQIQKFKKKN